MKNLKYSIIIILVALLSFIGCSKFEKYTVISGRWVHCIYSDHHHFKLIGDEYYNGKGADTCRYDWK